MKKIIVMIMCLSFLYSVEPEIKIFQDYVIKQSETKQKRKKIVLYISGFLLQSACISFGVWNAKDLKRK